MCVTNQATPPYLACDPIYSTHGAVLTVVHASVRVARCVHTGLANSISYIQTAHHVATASSRGRRIQHQKPCHSHPARAHIPRHTSGKLVWKLALHESKVADSHTFHPLQQLWTSCAGPSSSRTPCGHIVPRWTLARVLDAALTQDVGTGLYQRQGERHPTWRLLHCTTRACYERC